MLKSVKIPLLVLGLTVSLVCSADGSYPTCRTSPMGDLNGDCAVDFQDVHAFAGQWLDSSGGAADLDGDNKVGMADFAILAAEWRATSAPLVVINELHYDPDVKTELVEFVELHNPGLVDANLTGWYFSNGITYEFPTGAVLPAGGFIIVAYDPNEIYEKWSQGRFGVPRDLVYGPFVGKLANDGERVELCNADGEQIDQVDYQLGFPWPTVGGAMPATQPGTGWSMQLVNPFVDNDLAGSWRSATPTPAAWNKAVYAENTPPHIRQVKHSPKQPKSGEVVTITAKVTDPDGVGSVTLSYQLVDPGSYIRVIDGAYYTSWTNIPMHDDGLEGDKMAGDDIYTVQLAASLQTHRRLVRYRITLADKDWRALTVPYYDDPQPNFAYFVYDGVPGWRGAIQPGVTPIIEFSAEIMRSLPIYHLISRKSDVEDCTWFEKYQGDDFKWYGTLVYDGDVYDHIRYRSRGGVWRYAMGKNMWKFNFNRAHRFQARDDYGREYKTKWDKLNFSACIQQGSFGQRGEHGMFEALTNKVFNMASVPTSETNWVHFRIIDEPHEDGTLNAAHSPITSSGTQYDGDFWGVHMTLEQMDGRFLDEHDLPDGNLYKMDQAYPQGCEKNNQGPTAVTDKSDVLTFRSEYQSSASIEWWRSNVNLESYYGYYAAYNATHHGDITSKNHYFYQNPEKTINEWGENNLWWQLPWDVDLTWTTYYGSMSDPFSRSGVLGHAVLNIECRNRVREICDLLYNPEQMNQLIDEYASIINDPEGGLSIVDADRAMWDYHWVMGSEAYPRYLSHEASFKAWKGRFYEEAQQRGYEKSFEGMVQVMKDFVVERQGRMNSICSDSSIPRTPAVTATCPSTFPINALIFKTSPFSDPQGNHTFAAMKWRIAEVAAGSQIVPQDEGIVLIADGEQWKYFKGIREPSLIQGQWRLLGFDDSDWPQGGTPIGYGETFIVTRLDDMRGGYSTIYLRKKFDVTDLDAIRTLRVEAMYDDGINIWINGLHVAGGNVPSAELPFNAAVDNRSENHNFVAFVVPDPSAYLVSGTNVIAAHVINQSLSNSSDCFVDICLTGETGGGQEPPSTPPNYGRKPGKYEIDAVWQSDEITEFSDTITIPATAVEVGRTYRVRCRMKDDTVRWSHWSDPIQFETGEPLAAGILENLRITELMYNPADPPAGNTTDNEEFEFIELKNIGDETLDLTNVSFADGITFDFGGSSIANLAPGEFVLVVRNKNAFESRYGTDLSGRIAGQYTGRLANGGENVRLEDLWNGIIAEFEYGDSRGWPLSADGGGHSLVPLDSALLGESDGSLNYSGNWRASTYIFGSPGRDDPEPVTTVVLNEVMAHTDFTSPLYPEHDSNDWIELYNSTEASINLNNWYLSDDIDDLKKWAIPAVQIPAHGYISFDEVTDFHDPITRGFGLNKAGEQVVLSYLPSTSQDRVADYVQFKGQEGDASLGRYPDGGNYWFHLTPSRNAANTSPMLEIVVNALMYHPVDANDEYVELYNPTAHQINLENTAGPWRLDGGVDYTFVPGTSIPAGGRLIVVGFDPHTEISRLQAFAATYDTGPLSAGVNIVGPWSGNLSNAGERLALERPQPGDQPGDLVSWVIVDEVIYGDVSPWPEGPDGHGDALQRIHADQYHCGNDPSNWQAASPTPGN